MLWVSQKGLLRKVDFTEPAKVGETRYAADEADDAPIPADVREALSAARAVPDAPAQIEVQRQPAGRGSTGGASKPENCKARRRHPAPDDRAPGRLKLPDNAYARTGIPVTALKWQVLPAWGEAKDGLQVGIRVNGEASIGGKVLVELWITNSGKEDVRFVQCGRIDVGLRVMAKDKSGKDHSAEIPGDRSRPVFHGIQLPPGHITKLKEFALDLKSEAERPTVGAEGKSHGPARRLQTAREMERFRPTRTHEWRGELEDRGGKHRRRAQGRGCENHA